MWEPLGISTNRGTCSLGLVKVHCLSVVLYEVVIIVALRLAEAGHFSPPFRSLTLSKRGAGVLPTQAPGRASVIVQGPQVDILEKLWVKLELELGNGRRE